VLSIGAVFAGLRVRPDYFIGHGEHEFWRGAIFTGPTNHVLHEATRSPSG
jgi:NADH-quinone oxidoreductase subunit L